MKKYRSTSSLVVGILMLFILFSSSCSLYITPTYIKYPPSLGMTKTAFLEKFGEPIRYRSMVTEEGKYLDELVYQHYIDVSGIGLGTDMRRVLDIFIFQDGKLVEINQVEDVDQLIRRYNTIKGDRARVSIEVGNSSDSD